MKNKIIIVTNGCSIQTVVLVNRLTTNIQQFEH